MNTKTTRGLLAAAALAALAMAAPAGAAELGCEIPLFVQEGSVDANVMILFDNSGSMNEAMFHPDFDPFTSYSGPFDENRTFYISSSGNYKPRTVPGRPGAANQNSPTAYLVSSYWQEGRYRGNYLNWIFYHATDEQRATIPTYCRIDIAHAVVADLINRSSRIRFGLTKFNYDNFGHVVAPCGTSKSDLIYTVNHIQGDSWTPLGETMETILNYFERSNSNAPIIAKCQKNFCIVITDGFPTMDRNVSHYLWDTDGDGNDPGSCTSIGSPDPDNNDCSDFLDDVVYYMHNNDLRPDLENDDEVGQNVTTYAIGFGVDATILHDTAVNGGGLYFMAEGAADLWTSLELVMLDIISRISTGAAVAVVSTERGTDETLYRGKFMPGSWNGFLEAFDLPYDNGDPSIWEAGHLLAVRGANDRTIFTGVGSTQMDFTTSQAATLQPYLGVATQTIASDVISWTRGEYVANYRDRDGWILGDIIHSTPVVVGPPMNFSEDPDYQEFAANNAGRTRMIYVGANDGMLHAFEAIDGREKWAFVPQIALPELASIADTAYCHKYTVDLTPTVKDVKVNGVWRTILIGGGREGNAGYFALDVTYPDSPTLLWQVELYHDKAFSSEVEFANLGGTEVALIGTGLDDTSGEAYVEVYQVSDGTRLGRLQLSNDASRRNKATATRVVDLDLDGEDDLGYVADLQGHLWRLAFNGSANPLSWDVTCLWRGNYEITSTPVPAYGEANNILVYFGTGAYLDTSDLTTADANIFCCVYDRHDGAEYASLVDQTDTIHDIGTADGWYVRLEHEGERVTEPAAVVAGTVLFTSYAPSHELCSAGGFSWLWRVSYLDGDVPDDGEDDAWNGDRFVELGGGVASRPVVDIVNETVIVQSSDATITVQDIGQNFFHLTVRSWQETFGNNP